MSEAAYRGAVIKALKPLGADPIAIENGRCHPGTPDVNWLHGMLELKVIHEWPKRADTIVKCSTWTKEQAIWHRRRWNAGGSVYLLARIADRHLLFDGATAADFFSVVNREKLEALAVMNTKGLDPKLLLQHLLMRKCHRERR